MSVNLSLWEVAQAACRKYQAALMVVSKNRDIHDIEPFIQAGQNLFGESRLQEAHTKWPLLKKQHPHVKLHFIGQLQTNKALDVVRLFDCIHAVDRLRLVQALHEACLKHQKPMPIYIQVNVGLEAQKGGVTPQELPALFELCEQSPYLDVQGLMCIPPAGEDARPYFSHLATLAKALNLKGLSMGMSQDYLTALECGSTLVRIGSALFTP